MELYPIFTDESGKTRFNMVPAFALIAFFTLPFKDVYRIGVGLELGCDPDDPGEQVLQMVDVRYSETRSLYELAVFEFLH